MPATEDPGSINSPVSPGTTAEAWRLLEAELRLPHVTTAAAAAVVDAVAAAQDDAALLRAVRVRGLGVLADLRARLAAAEGLASRRAEAKAAAARAARERKQRAEGLLEQVRKEEAALATVDPAAKAAADAAAKARAARTARLRRLEEEREYLGQLQQDMALAAQGEEALRREEEEEEREKPEPEDEDDGEENAAAASARMALLEALGALAGKLSEAFPELNRYVCETGAALIVRAHGRWMGQLREALEACGWPPTMGSRGRRGSGDEEGEGDAVVVLSGRAVELLQAVMQLQAATLRFQFPRGMLELPGSTFTAGGGAAAAVASVWASEELSLPVLERFAFHFEEHTAATGEEKGGVPSSSAATDRPDWAFEFLLRALRLSKPALTAPSLSVCARESFPSLQALPHPLLALFARDMALAARRKVRGLLVDGSWTDDAALGGLAEAALHFDRALDEDAGYHRAAAAATAAASAGVAMSSSKWPRAAEVLVAPPERLERWAAVDAAWALAALEAAAVAPGAWGEEGDEAAASAASRQPPSGQEELLQQQKTAPAPPLPVAQAFAGLVAALTERYFPLRDASALRVLVNRTLKPLVRAYLNQLYDAAKGCRVARAPFHPGFEAAFARYCRVVTATQLGLEAIEDASGEVVILRLEGASSSPSSSTGAVSPKAAGAGVSSLVAGASSLLAAAVGSSELTAGAAVMGSAALRTASATTETLTRAVEESGTIIGPTRMLKRALGSITGKVVGTSTPTKEKGKERGGDVSSSSPARAGASGGEGGGALAPGTPSGSRPRLGGEGAAAPPPQPGDGVGRGESAGLEGAAMLMDDTTPSSSSSSALGFELLHLRSFRDGMLEDGLAAVTAGFHSRAHDYLTLLPPAPTPTRDEPSPTLLPALAFLDTVFRAAALGLEKEAALRLWQGLCYNVGQGFLRRVRAVRAVGEGGGRQLVVDVEALAAVLTRPSGAARGGGNGSTVMRPDSYLKALRESVGLLAWPGKSLESLHAFLLGLMEDDDVGEEAGGPQRGASGGGSAAAQISWALEAKGITVLAPEEVLTLVEARRRGDRVERGGSPTPQASSYASMSPPPYPK